MPELRYVGNADRYRLTNSDVDVANGETVNVDAETAEYLQEHGEFDVVESEKSSTDDELSVEDALEAGECPWCDEYEGDAVGQHAASAHPEEWDDYKEG
jgi:hypothetical protein